MMNSELLCTLAGLFDYPDSKPDPGDLAAIPAGPDRGPAELLDEIELLQLQEEYVRLFINALPEIPCPPYGSYYLEGTLMGRSTVWLRNLQQEYGLESDELPDHVAVEVELVGLLTRLGEEAVDVERDRDSVLAHLRKWLPAFVQRVNQHDSTGFYSSLSRCLEKTINIQS